ncbi:MAG: magnesium/cobalt transporter CorA [Acidobacteriota bacterium]|nr:magnesium/cobalt transporter CorA [Acidobacteriota bacterium]
MISVVAYGQEEVVEETVADIPSLKPYLGQHTVTWVDVVGLGTEQVLVDLEDLLGLHRLALEDVVNVGQRPKAEEYDDHHFIVLHMAHLPTTPQGEAVELEQVSLFVGHGYVISFQERAGDSFEPVRERIRLGRSRLRSAGADYLAYALVDAVVDGFFPVMENIGDRLEALEETIIEDPHTDIIGELHAVRRELMSLRRSIWPLRDALNVLQRSTSLFTERTQVFLRDAYDHALRLMDMAESLREMGSNLMDLHLSMVSHRMNEVMKVLTIISTIFIPLGFLAGLYGMNFDPEVSPWNMPELSWYWGYPTLLGVMLVVVILLIFYFRAKGWIGSDD